MANRDERYCHSVENTPEDEAYNVNIASNMTRSYRVRGRMMPLVGALTSLLFAVLVPIWCRTVPDGINAITTLTGGVLISLVAIPCHLLGGNRDAIRVSWVKSLLYVVGILLNTLGTSLCMTAYYVHLGEVPTTSALIAGALVPLALYAFVCLLIQVLPDRYGLGTGIGALLTVALMIVSIVFWVRSDSKVLFSFECFNLIWTLITVIALHFACSDEESPWLRFSSFAAFGILMAVAAIVLLILVCVGGGDGCDCDCGDGCGDCCDCGGACDGCGGSAGDGAAKKPKRRFRRRLGQ